MPLPLLLLVIALAGTALAIGAVFTLRAIDARPAHARRLAGPPEVKVGRLLAGDSPAASGAVRVAGRIRCTDPLHAEGGERLVAFHRDVEVRVGGAWRTIERLRETRSFELWDHDGSLSIDPSAAAEPLVVIPKVWHGSPSELEEPHASAVARLAEQHGTATEARATTRAINLTDRLLVLARLATGEDGRPLLQPPDGGYVITNLALDEAMRLLGGRHRRTAALAVVAVGIGALLGVLGAVGAAVAVLAGR